MGWGLLLGLFFTQSSLAAVSRPETPLPGSTLTLAWNTTWGGSATDWGNDVIRDTSGNLYIGGGTYSWGSGGADAIITKFQSNGEFIGNSTYGGPAEDVIYDMAITPTGNIVGGGRTRGWGLPDIECLVLTWNTNPTQLSNCTVGNAVTIQNSRILATENGILVGATLSYASNRTFVALISNNCAQSWNSTFQFPTSVSVGGLARDQLGNIYLAGRNFTNPVGVYSDIFIAKLDSNGNSLWNKTWDSGLGDSCNFAIVTPSNHLLLAGFYNNSQNYDLILLEFDLNGNYLRNMTWGGPGGDYPYAVAVAKSGNIYAIGYTTSCGAGNEDGLIVKFDETGTLLWNTTFGGTLIDNFYGCVLDDAGGLYIAGVTYSWGGVNQFDGSVLLLKLQDVVEGGDYWWILWLIIVITGCIVGIFLYFKLAKGRNIFKDIIAKFKKEKKPVST